MRHLTDNIKPEQKLTNNFTLASHKITISTIWKIFMIIELNSILLLFTKSYKYIQMEEDENFIHDKYGYCYYFIR